MPCYQPLKGFVLGVKENGKKDLKIYGNKVDHIEKIANGSYKPAFTYARSPSAYKVIREFIEIPCGRCIGCRLQKSKDWANRCMLELDYHETSYFVTLTYDNEHVHHSEFINDDGVVTDILTCKKRDFQLFMKRLRFAFPEQFIRYFACTEYGETTARPHCHAILFGLKLDDLRPIKITELGDTLYTSDKLASIWQNGIVSVGEVTWESCAYVARYVTKKQYGQNAEMYERYNIEPESCLMSLKPAIGKRYYEENPHKLFEQDVRYIKTPKGGRPISAPRYFKKKYEEDYPEQYQKYHDKHKDIGESKKQIKSSLTDLDYYDSLAIEGKNLEKKIKVLSRDEI